MIFSGLQGLRYRILILLLWLQAQQLCMGGALHLNKCSSGAWLCHAPGKPSSPKNNTRPLYPKVAAVEMKQPQFTDHWLPTHLLKLWGPRNTKGPDLPAAQLFGSSAWIWGTHSRFGLPMSYLYIYIYVHTERERDICIYTYT